jgi:hypothetical protein
MVMGRVCGYDLRKRMNGNDCHCKLQEFAPPNFHGMPPEVRLTRNVLANERSNLISRLREPQGLWRGSMVALTVLRRIGSPRESRFGSLSLE